MNASVLLSLRRCCALRLEGVAARCKRHTRDVRFGIVFLYVIVTFVPPSCGYNVLVGNSHIPLRIYP
jgi:hypothetical protein